MLRGILKQLLSGCPRSLEGSAAVDGRLLWHQFCPGWIHSSDKQHISMDNNNACKPIEYEANVTVDFRLDRCDPTHVV
jgi:hypothetical protein